MFEHTETKVLKSFLRVYFLTGYDCFIDFQKGQL